MPDLEMRFADPHTCSLCTATVPEPISLLTPQSTNSSGGLFSRQVFRRLSTTATTKSPTLQLHTSTSSSSGERSPLPSAPISSGAVTAATTMSRVFAGGGPILGGGSRTCSQMVIAFRYLLPRLLLMPVYQILYLADLLDVSRIGLKDSFSKLTFAIKQDSKQSIWFMSKIFVLSSSLLVGIMHISTTRCPGASHSP